MHPVYWLLLTNKSVEFNPNNKNLIMEMAEDIAKNMKDCIGISTYGWGIGKGKLQLVFK